MLHAGNPSHRTGFPTITAITQPQIEALLKQQVLQLELFEDTLAQVLSAAEGVRYLLRRNPQRVREIQQSRQSKQGALEKLLNEQNDDLEKHPRAQVDRALKTVHARAVKLKMGSWCGFKSAGRKLVLEVDPDAWAEVSKLDGCYVIKTDLPVQRASAQVVHDRYKDLTLVERNFRTCKTVELELRPVPVRLEASTRGPVFVVLLAHRLIQELQHAWAGEDLTVQEGLKQLSSLCVTEGVVQGKVKDQLVPEGRPQVKKLLELANVTLPRKLRYSGTVVSTKKKLTLSRPKRLK